MIEKFVHDEGKSFKTLPEIYQIEVCSACDLACPMCLRTTEMTRQSKILSLNFLYDMIHRGDFAGSYFTELQMAGEPTMHPNLFGIIRLLKDKAGVMVGLSTHGLNMSKRPKSGPYKRISETLLELDALTISVDSVDPEVYAKMRYPAKFNNLVDELTVFFDDVVQAVYNKEAVPFIELQLVESEIVSQPRQVELLDQLMKRYGWNQYASIRTTQDCFYEMDGRKIVGTMPRNSDLCLNPWTSVSVTADGNVVSCCYVFEPKVGSVNCYGNLNDMSLAEIWESDTVKLMRESHRTGCLKDQCSACYLKSPMLIHQNIVSRLVRKRNLQQ